MTPAETILKMLEDPAADCGELDARIWCFINKRNFLSHEVYDRGPVPRGVSTPPETIKITHDKGLFYISNYYTTSLDRAMDIGAEELEDWRITINQHQNYTDVTLVNRFHMFSAEMIFVTRGAYIMDTPRAICHARLQALEYVRGL